MSGATGILSQTEIYTIQYNLTLTTFMNEKEAQAKMNNSGLTLDTSFLFGDKNRVWVNDNPGNGLGNVVVACGNRKPISLPHNWSDVLVACGKPLSSGVTNVKSITLATECRCGGPLLPQICFGPISLFNKTPVNEADFRTNLDGVSTFSYMERGGPFPISPAPTPTEPNIVTEPLQSIGLNNFETYISYCNFKFIQNPIIDVFPPPRPIIDVFPPPRPII